MPRQTKKYVAACKALGLPSDHDLPHEAVYGMLTLRGFGWDGKRWRRNTNDNKPASIRIEADKEYVERIALALYDLLESSHASMVSVKGPYANRGNKQARIYINFTHPKEW